MIIRVLAAHVAIICALGACTTMPPEPRDEPQQSTIDETSPPSTEAALREPPENPELAAACVGDITCPPQFNNCIFQGDIDCGEEFCRTPGQQCDAQPSTFIRVEHVFTCFDPAGNACVSIAQGRRLVHCGC